MCQGPEEGKSLACFKTIGTADRDGVLRGQRDIMWDKRGGNQRSDEARLGEQVKGLGLILPGMGSEPWNLSYSSFGFILSIKFSHYPKSVVSKLFCKRLDSKYFEPYCLSCSYLPLQL